MAEGPEEVHPQEVAHAESQIARMETLRSLRRFRELAEASGEVLAQDPENPAGHYYRALALIELRDFRLANRHVSFLRGHFPHDHRTHFASMFWHVAQDDWTAVRSAAWEALQDFPEWSTAHYYAAFAWLKLGSVGDAQRHIQQARRLDPTADYIVDLAIRLMPGDTPRTSWERIEAFLDALRHNPNSVDLHEGIADVYRLELHHLRQAEAHYRDALRLEPGEPRIQKKLFLTVSLRDPVYRVLSIPNSIFARIGREARSIMRNPIRAIPVLLAFALAFVWAWLFFALWLAALAAVFWPAACIYEFLVLSEVRAGSRTSVGFLRWWYRFQRVPRWLRMTGVFAMLAGCWALAFTWFGIPLGSGFRLLGLFIGIHAVLVVGASMLTWVRAKLWGRPFKRVLARDGATQADAGGPAH